MERLTVPDVRVDERTVRRAIIDGEAVRERAMEIYWRLKAYEDTGLMPNDVTDMMAANGNAICEIVKLKEELQGAKNTAEQYAAINDTLYDSNMKLGADSKALINELCQYCGKYKKAHEGACDGCRWLKFSEEEK